MPNDTLKIFDSHARDSFGMTHSHGTCVLLEVSSVYQLTEYFKTCYRGDVLFELKAVKITTSTQPSIITSNDTNIDNGHGTINKTDITFTELCAVYLFSICFSTIKACKYWDDPTLDAIAEYAILFYKSLNIEIDIKCENLPERLPILDANVDIVYTRQQGMLSVSNEDLLMTVSMNAVNNTGCLLWFSDCCLACIFNHEKSGTKYNLVAYNGSLEKIRFELCGTVQCLIDKLRIFCMKQLKCQNVLYNVQFLSCSHKFSNSERQKIVRKHKSSGHKKTF